MKKNILKIHLEVLNKERQELLFKLLTYTKDFVLGGGTALSLQLGHRKSYDFDFFSQSKLATNLLEKLSQEVSVANIAIDTPDELTFFTKSDVKITFLHYPFAHAFQLEETEGGMRLFSVKDIALQKAYTIGRRGEYRDYFDLFTILKRGHIGLPEIIREAKKVYGGVFEEKIFLQQLVYFGDLLSFDIIPADSKPLAKPEEVKNFFENLVRDYV